MFCFYNRWFKFNDSVVTGVRSSGLPAASAYILFYSKEQEHKQIETKKVSMVLRVLNIYDCNSLIFI